MRRRLAGGNRLVWAAMLACLASAGYLAWQVWRPDAEPPLPPAPAAGIASAPEGAENQEASGNQEETFALADANEYADLVERPLFNRSRRPPAVSDAGGGAAGGAGGADEVAAANLSLAGVMLTRNRRVALVRIDNDPKVVHVGEGQQAGGWLIEQIRADRVILRRGENSSEVLLDFRRHSEGGSPPHGRAGTRSAGKPAAPPAPPGAPRRPPDEEQEEEEPTE